MKQIIVNGKQFMQFTKEDIDMLLENCQKRCPKKSNLKYEFKLGRDELKRNKKILF